MNAYTNVEQKHHLSQCLPNCEDSVIIPSKNIFKTFKVWIERAHQRKQLAKLDDRMLNDIGLSRVDVNREISKPFWR